MRILPGILVLAAVVTPALSQAQSGSVPTKADVQKIADEHAARRDAGQWDGYVEDLTPDATVMSSAGKWQRGRAEVLSSLKEDFASGVYKGTKTKVTVESVQAIAPNVILVDQTWELSNIPGGGTRKGRGSVVLVKSGETWKWAAERNMVPVPAGALK